MWPWLCSGSQRRQPYATHVAYGRDRASAGAARRPGRARPRERRRVLLARPEGGTAASIPGHCLEHGARGAANTGACRRDEAARARAAGVVRRGRCRSVKIVAGGAVRGAILRARAAAEPTAAHARPDAVADRERGIARASHL